MMDDRSWDRAERGEYGIVANICEVDKLLRMGAKVWVLGGWSGGGFERVMVRGAARSGRQIEKYVPITRLSNFRVAWAPDVIVSKATFFLGNRDTMAAQAARLAERTEMTRAEHPGRREMVVRSACRGLTKERG